MKRLLILSLLLFLTLFLLNGQRGFRYCKGIKIGKYDYQGQSAYSWLAHGDTVEHRLVLYTNQAYKIFVCGPKRLGQLHFQLFNLNKKRVAYNDKSGNRQTKLIYEEEIFFDSNNNPEGLKFWETLKNQKTRKVLIKIMLSNSNKEIEEAVDILVGRKPLSKKRFSQPRGLQW